MIHRKQFDKPPRRVALFVTCMVDMIYPEVGMSTAELLERLGLEVVFPYEQTCCGQPAFNAGYRDEARALAIRFINVFEPLIKQGVVDAIVAPSGSCTTMTSHFYGSALFEDPTDTALRKRAEALSEVTFELTEFLVYVLGITRLNSHFEGKLTYHACCHLLRELNIDEQPRALLSNVEGAEVIELPGAEECCGFGGLFSVKNPGISTAMGQRNIAAPSTLPRSLTTRSTLRPLRRQMRVPLWSSLVAGKTSSYHAEHLPSNVGDLYFL